MAHPKEDDMMSNRFARLIMGLLFALVLVVPVSAAPNNYMKQFKPTRIKSALTIPSVAAVKEVGGIRYGQHVDRKSVV